MSPAPLQMVADEYLFLPIYVDSMGIPSKRYSVTIGTAVPQAALRDCPVQCSCLTMPTTSTRSDNRFSPLRKYYNGVFAKVQILFYCWL